MPTPLFRLDLIHHLDPVLQLARTRPDRVQPVAWAVRTLAENTKAQGGPGGRAATATEAPTRAGAPATRPRHCPPPTYGLPGAPPL
jgi:hypothetical protein